MPILTFVPLPSYRVAMRAGGMLTTLMATAALVGCDASRSSGGYEATVEILVMPRDVSPDAQSTNSTNADFLATHIQLIQSRRVIRNAVEQSNLKELPSMAELVSSGQNVEVRIRRSVNAEQVHGGSIMRVRYSGPNQEDCAKVLEGIVLAYQSFLGETFVDPSEDVLALIEESWSELAAELADAEAEYREFRRQADLNSGTGSTAQEKLKTVEAALTELELERAKSEARLEVVEELLTETDPEPDTILGKERDNLQVELRILEKQQQKLTDMAREAEEQVKRQAAFEIEDKFKNERIVRLRELHEAVIERLCEINLIKDCGGFLTEIVAPIEVRQR